MKPRRLEVARQLRDCQQSCPTHWLGYTNKVPDARSDAGVPANAALSLPQRLRVTLVPLLVYPKIATLTLPLTPEYRKIATLTLTPVPYGGKPSFSQGETLLFETLREREQGWTHRLRGLI